MEAAEGGAYVGILDRALAEANAERHFSPHIRILSDMVNYGTNLIPSCWAGRKGGLRDIVALAVLLKQVLEALDASVVLLSRSCVKPCQLTLRSAFEASVYAEFVLRGRDDRAAKAYYVSYLRRSRRWANRAVRGTPERKAFLRDLRRMRFTDPFGSTRGQKRAKAEVAGISAKLASRRYRAWNARFDAMEKPGRPPVSWYEPLFRRRLSLRDICAVLGRRHEYRSIYETGSEEIHGVRVGAHIEGPEDGRLLLTPLRAPSEFPFIVKTLSGIALHTYRRTLEYYRPTELKSLARKYVTDWRPLLSQRITVVPERAVVEMG